MLATLTATQAGGACNGAPEMARILIIGEQPRALALGSHLLGSGHAVRVVLAPGIALDAGPDQEAVAGLELVAGDPLRLATLRDALAQVTVACWLFGAYAGPQEQAAALHGERLASFIPQLVDAGGRGLLYEPAGPELPAGVRARGEAIVRELAARNALALSVLERDTSERWRERAGAALAGLLEG